MGGKGSAPSNNEMVQFEREQADEARRKENERQARLTKGRAQISQIFHGDPVTTPQEAKLSLSSLSGFAPGAPTADGTRIIGTSKEGDTFKRNYMPEHGYFAGEQQGIGDTGWSYLSGYEHDDPGGGPAYLVYDPQGNFRGVGANWEQATQGLEGATYMKDTPTGKYTNEPFDQAFYDKYKNAYTNYYTPKVQQQAHDAISDAIYGFARAGLRGSTQQNTEITKLEGQRADELANVGNQADQAVRQQREAIATEEQKALGQLQSTEDPEVAANQAMASRTDQLTAAPQLTPLGDLFKPLVIGGIGAYNAYNDASYYNSGLRANSPNRSSGQTTG